jgi:hypothetical protein
MRSLIACAATLAALAAAPAAHAYAVRDVIPLKNGWTVLVFDDGKMSARDARGRVRSVWPGTSLETADGRTLRMHGDETWRRTPAEEELEDLYRSE